MKRILPVSRGAFRAPGGWCACRWSGRGVSAVAFGAPTRRSALVRVGRPNGGGEGSTVAVPPLLRRAVRSALAGLPFRPPRFDLRGVSPFERRVLRATARIARGCVATYAAIAARAGCPGGARAVGQVMHRNPLPLLIPCHRVVASGMRLGGYTGGLRWKAVLLKSEGIPLNIGRKFLYWQSPL